MYPVLIRRLADLRPGDRIIAHSGIRYPRPLRVVAPLGALPGSAAKGVRVETPDAEGRSQQTLYPWQMDGQVLDVDRPTPPAAHEHDWIEIGKQSPLGYRSWVCSLCPSRHTTIGDDTPQDHR